MNDYLWIEDPGHAWLRVPLAEVRASGANISDFSYRQGAYAYLEEDCDAGNFLDAIGLRTASFPHKHVGDVGVPNPRTMRSYA